jgi:hypothetical protein
MTNAQHMPKMTERTRQKPPPQPKATHTENAPLPLVDTTTLLGHSTAQGLYQNNLLQLQRRLGNTTVTRMLQQQAPPATDEAGPTAPLVPEDEHPDPGAPGLNADAEQAVQQASSSSGEELPQGLRSRFESSLGTEFGHVRLHNGAESAEAAAAVGAMAYTVGQDIHFGADTYHPETADGQSLIAHEVAHTVQQRGVSDAPQAKLEVSSPGDPYEVEAERFAQNFVSGRASAVSLVSAGAVARPKVLREPAPADPAATTDGQAGSGQPAPTDEWAKERDEMEGVRARAAVRQLQTEAYVELAATVLTGLKTKLEDASTAYSQAYKRYASVIAEGSAAAKNEEELLDIGVGILLAVAVGTGVGAAAGALEVGEGLAIEATKEAITATTAELAKAGAKHAGLLEVVGADMQPGGLKPEVMQLHLWQHLVDLHASALKTIQMADLQSLIASGAEYAIGEIKAQSGGGAGADMDVGALHNLIGLLASDDGQSVGLDAQLATATAALQGVLASLTGAPATGGREEEVERDIWLLWMAELSEEEAKVLDRDPIEKHLEGLGLISSYYGSGGSLGVDTGIWTTQADCLKMIEAAKGQAGELKAKYGSVTE